MKAVRIHRFGGPEVLQMDEVPMPEATDDAVVVKIHAASVNPVDYKIRQGGFVGEDKLPLIMGRDVSGTVAICGSAAHNKKVGDPLYAFLAPEKGGYAEFVVVGPGEMAAKPTRLDFVQAAGVPLAATTAWQGLFDHGGLKAGQRVLIHGAAGGVGHFAVQFAHAKGAQVIATASAKDLAFVRGLGADAVVNHQTERFEDVARGVDMVFDLIGGETQDRSWDVLKPGGVLVCTVGEPDQAKALAQGVRGVFFMARPNGEQLNEITHLIDEGLVRVEITLTLPLAQAAEAQQRLEQDHPRGKVVLTVAS